MCPNISLWSQMYSLSFFCFCLRSLVKSPVCSQRSLSPGWCSSLCWCSVTSRVAPTFPSTFPTMLLSPSSWHFSPCPAATSFAFLCRTHHSEYQSEWSKITHHIEEIHVIALYKIKNTRSDMHISCSGFTIKASLCLLASAIPERPQTVLIRAAEQTVRLIIYSMR